MKALMTVLLLALTLITTPVHTEELEAYILPDDSIVYSLEEVETWIREKGVDWMLNNFGIEDIPDDAEDPLKYSKKLPEVPDNQDFESWLYNKLEQGKAPCLNNIVNCEKVWI